MGSYGIVFQGRWKGVDVAVKRFIKQRLDERHMLEFRAEMALLSELHHPNIVLFIGTLSLCFSLDHIMTTRTHLLLCASSRAGACVKAPNLCIVTEFVRQGNVRDMLNKTTIKLEWALRMRMLRGAAIGVDYLHSLSPVIVHRDLKSSNLLVRLPPFTSCCSSSTRTRP
jgi:serine/threonine protein kinase